MLKERTFVYPILHRDRVTATEMINGTHCRIVLEQDMFGRYRESTVRPIEIDLRQTAGAPISLIRDAREAVTEQTRRGYGNDYTIG